MNSYLLNRSQGSIIPSTFHLAQCVRLVHSLAPAPGIRFSSSSQVAESSASNNTPNEALRENLAPEPSQDEVLAHKSGANVLTIDQYEKRYMVSGGADSSIHLWDLEGRGAELNHVHQPVASVSKKTSSSMHTHALTSISIYPFDPTPSTILTSSHDTTLKLSSLGQSDITPVHTFALHSTPYSHSLSSHPSSHMLIGVGTSDQAVRLLDLRSGLSTHALPGHSAAVLSVDWAPHNPHLIASASKDNRVIIFDVRRGGRNSAIASLDMDDAVGVLPHTGRSSSGNRSDIGASTSPHNRKPFKPESRAHNGAVTGVRWTSDGTHLVTSGHDSRIRVWDASTGSNTLVHFGPRIRNTASLHLAERAPLVLPTDTVGVGHETLLWPNYNDHDDRGEIFMFELRDGTFIKQLRVPGLLSRHKMRGKPTALSAARINALAWRGDGGSGEGMEMFSAHGDGTVRAWVSRTREDEEIDAEADEAEREDKKRKRDVLEEVYRGLMQPGLTFT